MEFFGARIQHACYRSAWMFYILTCFDDGIRSGVYKFGADGRLLLFAWHHHRFLGDTRRKVLGARVLNRARGEWGMYGVTTNYY